MSARCFAIVAFKFVNISIFMSFFYEISKILGVSSLVKNDYNILLVNGNCLYIDGISRILSITDEQIQLSVKKNTMIEIVGTNLVIQQSSIDSMVINGQIDLINLPKSS